MKSAILLLAVFAAAFSSCTTAYKTGQTPDDVYYSPAPPKEEYVRTEKEQDRKYQYTDEYYDDRYLRMKVSNRYRWNDLNDWYYYERYGFGHNYYFGSYYNPYNSWNYYYNPYCCCYGNNGYSNPKYTAAYRPQVKPRAFSLGGYTNTNVGNTSANRPVRVLNSGRVNDNTEAYNNRNKPANRGLGNTIRTILSSNNDNSGNNSSNNSRRVYTPSNSTPRSNSSSSGSSSGSSGGSVTRPTRN